MTNGMNRSGRRNFGSNMGNSMARNSGSNIPISRGQFVKGLGFVGGAVVSAGLFGSHVVRAQADPGDPNPDGLNIVKPSGQPATQNDPIIWVYPLYNVNPIGDFATMDVRNVQWAVNNVQNDGIVILKVSPRSDLIPGFLFTGSGASGFVSINQSVKLFGEGTLATKVFGGQNTLTQNGGSVTVNNISFDGPMDNAILIFGSEKTSITNCAVSNLQFVDPSVGGWDAAVTLAYTNQGSNPAVVEIKNNIFDIRSNPNIIETVFTVACVFEWFSNANVVIDSNYMAGGVYSSVFDIANAGTNTITNNLMRPDPPNAISSFGGAGVWIVGGDVIGDSLITKNEIDCPPNNSFAFGYGDFVCAGPNVVFSHNKINIPSCFFTAIALHGAVSNAIIVNNQVKGSVIIDPNMFWFSPVGALISFFESDCCCEGGAQHNVLKGNSFAPLKTSPTSGVVDVYLGPGANRNTIVGQNGTVYNAPTNEDNVITGFNVKSSYPSQVGQNVSRANQVIQDIKKRFNH